VEKAFVSGVGFFTPLGNSWAEICDALRSGRSGIDDITLFDASDQKVRIAGEVRDFNPADHMDAKAARRMARSTQFAVAAARQAVENAGIDLGGEDEIAAAVYTGGGGLEVLTHEERVYEHKGARRVSPLLVPLLAPSMPSTQVSIQLGITGPVLAATAACATGIYALLDALHLVQRGDADVVIAGATEAMIVPAVVASLANMGALTTDNAPPWAASRPFDLHRKGFVLSEGAGVVVVESERHLVRRSGCALAEIRGGALTADAHHITEPDPSASGAARAIARAIARTGLEPTDIDYICAHGTGTPLNDRAETKAIKMALGDRAYSVPISSPKSMAGHLLGAAGMVSLAACLMAFDGIIPPTINLDTPDPECDLDYVPNVARAGRVRHALANGFGFGGQNAVMVLSAP